MKLYLGVVPKDETWYSRPEIIAKMKELDAGIIFSYFVFKKEVDNIISKGIHDYFNFDGPIMIDSGAYSAWNSGVNINVHEYSAFLGELKANENDIIVNLDVVGDRFYSFRNWCDLKRDLNYLKVPMLPVFHYPDVHHNYKNESYLGLGGMVKALKINEAGSVYDLAFWIPKLPKNYKYHGFGIGSPLNQIIFDDYLYSVDWMGWRRNAAVCAVYTPEGSRTVQEARKKPKKDQSMTRDLFEKYKPKFIENYGCLYQSGTEGWYYRAIWNIWHFLVAQEYKDQIIKRKYVKQVINHLEKEKPLDLLSFM